MRAAHPLRMVFWEATRRCNLACVHCGSSCTDAPLPAELSTEEVLRSFRTIAQDFDPARVLVAITGGEPLVRADLFVVMSALRGLGFPIGMVSNGWAIDEAKADKLRANGLVTISVSVDGVAATHDRLRGRAGSFDRAARALRALIRQQGLAVEVITCVSRHNLDELPEIYRTVRGLGVPRWRLELVFPIGRAAAHPEWQLDASELRRTLDFIAGIRTRERYPVAFGCGGWLGLEFERRVRDAFFFCHAGVSVGSILANGDISACPDIDHSFIQGNVRRDRFSHVWKHGFVPFRDRAWTRTSRCTDCRAYADCQGGAMHMWNARHEQLGCSYRSLGDP